jgi:hypothetical protein
MYRRGRFVAGKDAGGRRSHSCGDDEDAVQGRIWPARRHDDFREGPLVAAPAQRIVHRHEATAAAATGRLSGTQIDRSRAGITVPNSINPAPGTIRHRYRSAISRAGVPADDPRGVGRPEQPIGSRPAPPTGYGDDATVLCQPRRRPRRVIVHRCRPSAGGSCRRRGESWVQISVNISGSMVASGKSGSSWVVLSVPHTIGQSAAAVQHLFGAD